MFKKLALYTSLYLALVVPCHAELTEYQIEIANNAKRSSLNLIATLGEEQLTLFSEYQAANLKVAEELEKFYKYQAKLELLIQMTIDGKVKHDVIESYTKKIKQ